jgi:spore coat protein CotH
MIDNLTLPIIEINTQDNQLPYDKEEYINCSFEISNCENDDYNFSVPMKRNYKEDGSVGIRLRGNSTMTARKRPYRIKFDEKVSIFGEAKNKSWVLLALYNDYSAVKDKLAFTMADAIGTDAFVPSYHYVELYMNGRYKGLYLLTDQVDENKGRSSVKEDFTADDLEVPFLVELDAYAPQEGEEGIDWFRIGEDEYAIKYPEVDERYTQEQFDYIKNYITDVDAACRSGNLDKLSQLVDVDSFIDYYIVQEVMGQAEMGWKSVYMYKSKDGLMKMGPLWDFDWSVMGPCVGKDRHLNKDRLDEFYSNGNWFGCMLVNSPEFKTMVGERFDEVKDILISVVEDTRTEMENLKPYYDRNHLRWHWFRVWENREEYSSDVLDWVTYRIEWLDTAL